MRAAWHCGSAATIRADAALQGCANFASLRSHRCSAGAGKDVAYLARNLKFESISLQR
jgi:N-acetylmuramoyl-L-alanine amidase CwlA